MSMLKDLMENEALVKNITEDIDEIPEDAEVTYEVWAIGYNKEDVVTDSEMFIRDFNDPDEAVDFASKVTLADIVHQAAEEDDGSTPTDEVAYISVEVESVIADGEDDTMNIGTVYKRDLWIDGEYGSEEDIEDFEDFDPIVELSDADYELSEEGDLLVDCKVLKDFNKNDYVKVKFINEDNAPVLTYKIISKTTANKFICEFEY